jgi:ABC-type nitrate/sulfonate/bicarbonate transport system ATPase subunit
VLDLRIDLKTYPDRGGKRHDALRGLQLDIARGEFVCLVGPSGCGKSTLLNIVGGLDPDFVGEVRVDGAAPGPGIGFMFQSPRLMPWLSVLDNVRLVLDGSPAEEARARQLLAAMELSDVLAAYPGRLSGGMQRRVALARAFAVEPRLLLMDEPFVSLDAPTADRLRGMLIELQQRCGSTVLFVTHDLREALALADRVCFLSGSPGRIVYELPIAAAKPRRTNDSTVNALYDDLLRRHPDLLAGLTTAEAEAA